MHSSYQGGDPAEFPQASCGFDYDAVDEAIARHEKEDCLRRGVAIPSEVAIAIPEIMRTCDALIKFIAFLMDATDYLLRLDVAIAAIGCPLHQGWSYTAMAVKHGISKQAFDKHVLKFQREFQLPITRAQKSTAARKSYQKHKLERKEYLEHLGQLKQQNNNKERTELVWQYSLRKAPKEQSDTLPPPKG